MLGGPFARGEGAGIEALCLSVLQDLGSGFGFGGGGGGLGVDLGSSFGFRRVRG